MPTSGLVDDVVSPFFIIFISILQNCSILNPKKIAGHELKISAVYFGPNRLNVEIDATYYSHDLITDVWLQINKSNYLGLTIKSLLTSVTNSCRKLGTSCLNCRANNINSIRYKIEVCFTRNFITFRVLKVHMFQY